MGVRWSLSVIAVLGFASGCFASHMEGGATPGPGRPGPGGVDVPPAPGEGSLCHALGTPPVGCGGGGRGICDAAVLRERLASARRGDVVHIGRCSVRASVRVPAGVVLSGVDPEESVLEAPRDGAAVHLDANGDRPAVVRCLTIQSDGEAAIVASGAGEAHVSEIHVELERGIGIGAEDLDVLRVHASSVVGPVTPGNADSFFLDPRPSDTGTHGVVLTNVRAASLSNVRTDGLAQFGVLSVDSTLTWRGGGADSGLGAGVMVSGGRACLRGLGANGMLQGLRLLPPYGIVVSNGAEMTGAEIVLADIDGVGALLSEASARLEGLSASGNQYAAVWIQNAERVEIVDSIVAENTFAGIHACSAAEVSLDGVEVTNTQAAVRLSGEVGTVEIGVGVNLAHVARGSLTDVGLVDNEQAGLIVDLGIDEAPDVVFHGVEVETTSRFALGAAGYLRDPPRPAPPGWDDGIVRHGDLAERDGELLGPPPLPECPTPIEL